MAYAIERKRGDFKDSLFSSLDNH
ncbi:hypothetical protein CCACVL1_15514 [Corchorus capsularis]|uniref:Uncharacterized protein n=1 Tax=Corchorus capsularis TaxID=210143 RepID=A0A1R3I237_COCAP|nr:hypothetical protein CCACVL1_15514 [Corchorus capsularis]